MLNFYSPRLFQGRCAPLELDGEPGIFVRSGYWYGLQSEQWRKLAIPPNDPVAGADANNMWSFGGRPTIFGHRTCGEDGECHTKVQRNGVFPFLKKL